MKKLTVPALAAILTLTLAVAWALAPAELAEARPPIPPGEGHICWQAHITADIDNDGTYENGVNWLAGGSLSECLPVLAALEAHAVNEGWDYTDDQCQTYTSHIYPCPTIF